MADCRRAKIQYREALLMSKRTITERDDSRYELRDGATAVRSAPGEQNGEDRGAGDDEYGNAGEDEVQTKSNEVTDALRRTTQIMQAELERSVLSVQMLGA
jgi:protein transport protein SEC20